MQTHLEPLAEATEAPGGRGGGGGTRPAHRPRGDRDGPRELRFLNTTHGLVAFLTLGLDGTRRLDESHQRASEIEERIRRERPDIADVIVHTEP